MGFPEPAPGLVIRYSYLWLADQLKGQEEGVKDRPCAIILATGDGDGEKRVTVLPVTHSTPRDPSLAMEIPQDTKKRLGLDGARSWVVLSEANQFTWPGPDLRPERPGEPESVAYGLLPRAFFLGLRDRFVPLLRARRAAAVSRNE